MNDSLYIERNKLQVQNRSTQAEIWRLEKIPATQGTIQDLSKQIRDNTVRISALDQLIQSKLEEGVKK